jgi:ABC-type oligopeptide transport system substrate-binding subunit
MALNDIHKRAKTDEELQNLRSELRELMAWRSDMLPIYDQAMRRLDIPNLASNIHKRIEAEHLLAITRLKSQPSLENNRKKARVNAC